MVEDIDVSSYDKKKFDELIQVGFRKKKLLNITLCKARSKPSEVLEIELSNVPAMKEGEISLAMVFRNKPSCIIEENCVIKCYDVIEEITHAFCNCSLACMMSFLLVTSKLEINFFNLIKLFCNK